MTMTLGRFKALPFMAIALLGGGCLAHSQEPDKAPDPILTALQTRLERELADLKPVARFEIPAGYGGKTMIVRYRTRNYMIYPSHKGGRLDHELVEQEGPDDEGILLKVHVQPKGEANQAVVPQTLQRPYWKTYLNVYPVGDSEKQIYIALSYRGRTDKKLIQKIQKVAAQTGAERAATSEDSEPEGKESP